MLKTSLLSLLIMLTWPLAAWASEAPALVQNLTATPLGLFALLLFVVAYTLVIFEEQLHLRKSKPVIFAAGIIWVLVAIAYAAIGDTETPHNAIKHNLIEYAELFLFLLAAMTYINALDERSVFQALRA